MMGPGDYERWDRRREIQSVENNINCVDSRVNELVQVVNALQKELAQVKWRLAAMEKKNKG